MRRLEFVRLKSTEQSHSCLWTAESGIDDIPAVQTGSPFSGKSDDSSKKRSLCFPLRKPGVDRPGWTDAPLALADRHGDLAWAPLLPDSEVWASDTRGRVTWSLSSDAALGLESAPFPERLGCACPAPFILQPDDPCQRISAPQVLR